VLVAGAVGPADLRACHAGPVSRAPDREQRRSCRSENGERPAPYDDAPAAVKGVPLLLTPPTSAPSPLTGATCSVAGPRRRRRSSSPTSGGPGRWWWRARHQRAGRANLCGEQLADGNPVPLLAPPDPPINTGSFLVQRSRRGAGPRRARRDSSCGRLRCLRPTWVRAAPRPPARPGSAHLNHNLPRVGAAHRPEKRHRFSIPVDYRLLAAEASRRAASRGPFPGCRTRRSFMWSASEHAAQREALCRFAKRRWSAGNGLGAL